ncbi:MAG: response regulator [bacterium]|nr:response regulator [bacterium]
MAVVWGTVKDHNGYIDVQSELGEGTTFTLYFPITRQNLPDETPDIMTDRYLGKGESVLIVDDVQQQREIASGMLKKLGYSVLSVPSGEEAVIYLQENTADLLVLDMIMNPGMDGLETYKRILEFHPQQKAVIASGYSESKQVKAAQKMGAGSYLKKPYSFEKIGLAVKAELER